MPSETGASAVHVPPAGAAVAPRFLQRVWGARELLVELVWRDLRARYAGSLAGGLWNIGQPLLMIAIYTIVFSSILEAKVVSKGGKVLNYAVYLCAGLLPWNAFSEAVTRGIGVFVENATLVKKVSFPKVILLIHVNLASAVNLVISLVVFVGILALAGQHLTWAALALLPVLMLLQFMFALGLGMALSALYTYFRDVGQIANVALMLWFWLTPIVYVRRMLPPWASPFLELNPMYYLMRMYQGMLAGGATLPDLLTEYRDDLLFFALLSVSTLLLGKNIFGRVRHEIPDLV